MIFSSVPKIMKKFLLFIKNKDKKMKIVKKHSIRIAIIVMTIFLVNLFYGKVQVQANEAKSLIQQQLEYYTRNMDVNNISKEDVLKVYDDITDEYTNDEIANMIKDNAEEMKKQGISEEVIGTSTDFIKTTDAESIREIIENDIDVEDIKQKINQGYTPNEILKSVIQEMPNEKKAEIATKLILSNYVVKTGLIIVMILFIYGTILRWIIYVKAGKHGWAAIIPFYRQIVMYQVCGLSPWLILLWFVPIVGWIAMLIIAIMKRFCLASEFGMNGLFGLGLLLFPPIFQSILAFNSNIEKTENG